MPIPPRSELPPEFVDKLELFDEQFKASYGRKPILPAAQTPDLLVEMAIRLDNALNAATGSEAAKHIEHSYRGVIDATIARTLTQPLTREQVRMHPHVRRGLDLHEYPELDRAFHDFDDRVRGTDHSDKDRMERHRMMAAVRRETVAKTFGLELELTEEEWLQL